MDEKLMMTLHIQQIGFMLVELNLYLDTHPTDRMALSNYNMLSRQYHQMMMDYTMKFGALMNFGHSEAGADSFNWISGPWPWQRGANPTSVPRG
jgi:spore coat protein JB